MTNHPRLSWYPTTMQLTSRRHAGRPQIILFAALSVSSLISVALLLLRVLYSGSGIYTFLLWNLLLAWMPLALAWLLWLAVDRLNRPLLGPALLPAWFLFFPNAPYIMTDLIHLRIRDAVPIWYDAALLFSFAWNGLILGFVSLWMVQGMVARRRGAAAGWLLALGTLGAGGFGIYLGRFLRWNSWDVVMDPRLLLNDVFRVVSNPLDHPLSLAVSGLFAMMLLVMYMTLTILMSMGWNLAPVSERR